MSGPLPRAWAVALLAALLGACGGGTEVSWCVGGDGFSAGYNHPDCRPNPDRDAVAAVP